ncbi:MAG: hypothetical protein IT514_15640, partial [Burkholderiales bacterium]|nr:hypothetical protein [Burkholderiales bacterium]
MLGDEHEAEDAVQDALLLAWRSSASLRDPRAFEAWIIRIARNAAVCRLRAHIRRRAAARALRCRARQFPALHGATSAEVGAAYAEAREFLPATLRRTLDQNLAGLSVAE